MNKFQLNLRITGLLCLVLGTILTAGCNEGWNLDYAEAEAHIQAEDLDELGSPYVGKMIVIKGVVTKTDTTQTGSAKIFIGTNITCDLGDFKAMAESRKAGDTIFIKGYLKSMTADNILISPAVVRDDKAPFNPLTPTEKSEE